jgi:pyridoxamine 5'-phosphate oxidase
MTYEDCIEYIEQAANGFLATVEGEKPHVRPMTVWLADRSGIYFYTSAVKPLASQLLANPNVEIAFCQPGVPPDIGTALRIAGRMEIVEDMNIRKRLYETFAWLKQIGTGTPDSPTIVVFRMPSGRFNFWTWENNVSPGPWVQFP